MKCSATFLAALSVLPRIGQHVPSSPPVPHTLPVCAVSRESVCRIPDPIDHAEVCQFIGTSSSSYALPTVPLNTLQNGGFYKLSLEILKAIEILHQAHRPHGNVRAENVMRCGDQFKLTEPREGILEYSGEKNIDTIQILYFPHDSHRNRRYETSYLDIVAYAKMLYHVLYGEKYNCALYELHYDEDDLRFSKIFQYNERVSQILTSEEFESLKLLWKKTIPKYIGVYPTVEGVLNGPWFTSKASQLSD
eukprot:NODE_610_length_5431_cov_0.738560.p2 type:complete len:249 gc:universal NODE_610_length_5431_cov_0.738560:3407-4153(+)